MSTGGYENAVAVILISAEPGRERDVIKELREIPEVKEALLLFGEYDVFAIIECEDFGILSDVVVKNIRNIEGVGSTKTLTAAPMLD